MDRGLLQQMGEVESNHWWFVGRRRILAQVLGSLKLPESPRILDLGCGTGGNLRMLAEFGQVVAIEPDATAATLASQQGVGPVLPGQLPDALPRFSQPFHLVLLLDVLEHTDDDVASLRAIRELLAPSGFLVITVPAFPILWSRHDDEHGHRRRYRIVSLHRALERGGYRVVHLTYFNAILFPIAALVRLIRRVFPPTRATQDIQVPPRLANRALLAILSREAGVVPYRKIPFGLSLLAVAQPT